MRTLVDPHVVLWAAVDDVRLRGRPRATFVDPANTLVVSVLSLYSDPFDRMRVATALVEGIPLTTGDDRLTGYDDCGLVRLAA